MTKVQKPEKEPAAKKAAKPRDRAKRRTPVPLTVAASVMVESDRMCCVCRSRDARQIHHLNEDPSDHRFENLAALCFECHDDTQVRGGFGRRLRGSEVQKHRDSWCMTVRTRRETGLPRAQLTDSVGFMTMVDAAAVVRIRELGFGASRDGHLDLLQVFTRGFGHRVALEALVVLSTAASYARDSRGRLVEICALVHEFLPISSLVAPQRAPVGADQRIILDEAHALGREIAYAAAQRTKDLAVLDAGARILWAVLRWSVLNEDASLRDDSASSLAMLRTCCKESRFPDGATWLAFLVADATQPHDFKGTYPADIAGKIRA